MNQDISEEEILSSLSLQKPIKKRKKPGFWVRLFALEKDMAKIAD